MSEIEDEVVIDPNNDEELELDDVEVEQPDVVEDEVPEKPQETLAQKRSRLARQLDRIDRKLGTKDEPQKTTKSSDKSDIDFGQLAFYNSQPDSVKIAPADVDFLKEAIADTGKDQQTILNSKWFQSDLKERQAARATADATPKGTKRSAQPSQQDEGYWLAKIESGQAAIADISDVTLRRKVLNMRIEKEKVGSRFSSNPIVYNG